MLFTRKKKTLSFLPNFKLTKINYNSNGYRLNLRFKRKLPLQIICPKLTYKRKYNSGRNQSGRIVLYTRKSRSYRLRAIKTNYVFRSRNISFIGSMIMLPFVHKLLSLVFLSSGSVTYIPATTTHKLFTLLKLYKFNVNVKSLANKLTIDFKQAFIEQGFFLLSHLPRNKPISLLEILPGRGIQYVRSPGTSARMTRVNRQLNTGLVTLPSGVKKIFSIFSIASLGSNLLPESKLTKNNKAGYYSISGKKPRVRGVAKNPIDHPHGGNTKTINHPRTPWGLTTKRK